MLLERIEIKNYKSIRDASLDLRNVNIFIGANNAGKSNFLDFINFHHRIIAMRHIEETFGPGPFHYRYVFSRAGHINKEAIRGHIVARDKSKGSIVHSYEVKSSKGMKEGKFKLRLVNEHIIFDHEEFKRESSDQSVLKERWDEKTLKRRTILWNYTRFCRSCHQYQFVPKEIKRDRQVEVTAHDIPYLMHDGSNLVNVLFHVRDKNPERFQAIIDDFQEIYPEVVAIAFKYVGGANYSIEFSRRVDGEVWKFLGPEISDGFAITLAILTLINLEMCPKLVLMEEIENGLNPSTLSTILQKILKVSQRSGVQFFITTHSPVILELMSQSPEYIIVCSQDRGETTFTNLTEILHKFGDDYEHGESLFHLWFNGLIGGL